MSALPVFTLLLLVLRRANDLTSHRRVCALLVRGARYAVVSGSCVKTASCELNGTVGSFCNGLTPHETLGAYWRLSKEMTTCGEHGYLLEMACKWQA